MNFFKTIGAGFAKQGREIKTNWKFIIGFGLFMIFMFFVVVPLAAIYGFKGLIWLIIHTPKNVNDFINRNAIYIVLSMVGAMLVYAFSLAAYREGKKKLQNDQVSPL